MAKINLAHLGLPVTLILVGCDALPTRFVTGLSAEERARAAQTPVHRERLAEGTYTVVGPVQGHSCQIAHDDPYRVSEDHAIEELQRATFKAGGTAVMEVACEQFGWRQGTRSCFSSIECRGTAVRAGASPGVVAD